MNQGGTLRADGTGPYSGTITLTGGTLSLGLVQPAISSAATLDLTGVTLNTGGIGAAPVTLKADGDVKIPNPWVLEFGSLILASSVDLTGNMTVKPAGTAPPEFDPDQGVTVGLGGSFTSSSTLDSLVIGGKGQVQLDKTFNGGPNPGGAAGLTVDGGTLVSSVTVSFDGTVKLNTGTLKLGANNAVGTGSLFLGSLGKNASIQLLPVSGHIIAVNMPTTFYGGSLAVSGAEQLQLAGAANNPPALANQLSVETTLNPAPKTVVAFINGLNAAQDLHVGGGGSVQLGGQLLGRIQVDQDGLVVPLATFGGTGSIVVNSGGGFTTYNGSTLASNQRNTFAGTVTGLAGSTIVFDANFPLGQIVGGTTYAPTINLGSTAGGNPVALIVTTGAVTMPDVTTVTFAGGTILLAGDDLTLNNLAASADTTVQVLSARQSLIVPKAFGPDPGAPALPSSDVTLNGGMLQIGGTLSSGLVVQAGTLWLMGTLHGTGTIDGNGGTIVSSSNNTFAGTITMAGGNLAGTGVNPFGVAPGAVIVNRTCNLTASAGHAGRPIGRGGADRRQRRHRQQRRYAQRPERRHLCRGGHRQRRHGGDHRQRAVRWPGHGQQRSAGSQHLVARRPGDRRQRDLHRSGTDQQRRRR